LDSQVTLLVANAGGHLKQLTYVGPPLVVGRAVWAVPPTSSSSVPDESETVAISDVQTRGWTMLPKNIWDAHHLIKRYRPARIVSTGAGVALGFAVMARIHDVDFYYVESVTRTRGPSLTGRLVSWFGKPKLYTQWPDWADGCWTYLGTNVFDLARSSASPSLRESRKGFLVGTGTKSDFPFPRMAEAAHELLARRATDHDVGVWQLGAVADTFAGRPQDRVVDFLPHGELQSLLAQVKEVYCHAGVGLILDCLEHGLVPVVFARDPARREHVDTHQADLLKALAPTGLVRDGWQEHQSRCSN
jgi:UDP-N-acetylglucosamine--N-acetylmuramyl-(pentapeptide) pyrophosphoryl-undecaprenol N-acetylglucosamine transferase